MKIFLTGGSGQLGSALKSYLANDGHMVFDPKYPAMDITRIDDITTYLKSYGPFDAIINTAAVHNVELVQAESWRHEKLNVSSPCMLTMQAPDVPFFQISTSYVFSGKPTKKGYMPYVESSKPAPINEYGSQKYSAEIGVKTYSDKPYIIRLSNLYRPNYPNFITRILKTYRESVTTEVPVVADQWFQPTPVDVVAIQIMEMINNLSDYSPGTYHIAPSHYTTPYIFANLVLSRILGRTPSRVVPKFTPDSIRPRFAVLANSKLPALPSVNELFTDRLDWFV